MPSQLALFICVLFILWLFAKDSALRPMTSRVLWIPLLWIMIIGSRPVSLWFGDGFQNAKPEEYLDGSPLDRNIFIVLILIGLLILFRRNINWGVLYKENRIFILFSIYCAISVIWSDNPFVSFKRWIKEFGNVVMILIILTEKDPLQAMIAVFSRFTYLAIPLSILFIKYFPQLGRYFNRWTWEPVYAGVATHKNGLGAIVFICGLFLVWDLFRVLSIANRKNNILDVIGRVVLLIMVTWLITMAHSSTSLVCLIFGVSLFLFIRCEFAKRHVKYINVWFLIIIFMGFIAYSFSGVFELLTGIVERDITLTGRTELWEDLLKIPINPIIGAGYEGFWQGSRVENLWEKFSFHPNQAHNGYLETYLNGGFIGVILFMVVIFSTGRKLTKELFLENKFVIFCFVLFVVTLLYNWTEAMFNKQSIVWISLLIAILWFPGLSGYIKKNRVMCSGLHTYEPFFKNNS